MNTRFNPTVNGEIHIGHAYLCLLNYHAAKRTGGKFIVRFDDDQQYWVDHIGSEQMRAYSESVKNDLAWLGIEPDYYTSEAEEREANERAVHSLSELVRITGTCDCLPQVIGMQSPYPYVAYLTAMKVVSDRRDEIDLLIRGTELLTEFSLYAYFCALLKYPLPKFQYVPRLMKSMGFGQHADLANVSKTAGGLSVRDYRDAGWDAKRLTRMLADSCLNGSAIEWTYNNVRSNPIVRELP